MKVLSVITKSKSNENNKKVLLIELKYAEGRGVIRQIDRVSKPGRRVYKGAKDMPRFYNGLGYFGCFNAARCDG